MELYEVRTSVREARFAASQIDYLLMPTTLTELDWNWRFGDCKKVIRQIEDTSINLGLRLHET